MQATYTIATERQISEWEYVENNISYLGTLNFIKTIENPDFKCLETALKFLCNRHDSLRTSFGFVDGILMQIIQSEIDELPLFYEAPHIVDDRQISVILEEFLSTKFNLTQWPLFKIVVLSLNQTYCKVGFIMSHIISDATSMQILSDELSSFYESYKLKIPIEVCPLNFQMKEYALLEKDVNESAEGIENLAFWENLFSTLKVPGFSNFQVNKHYIPDSQHLQQGGIDYCFVSTEVLKSLKRLCSNEYLAMIASVSIWLSFFYEEENILLAFPFSARDNPNLNGVVGYLIRGLYLKVKIENQLTFKEIILKVIDAYGEAISRRHYSRRSINVDPVPLSHILINNLSNMQAKPNLDLSVLNPHLVDNAPIFPIDLAINNYRNGWLLRCFYDTGKFNNNNFRFVYKNYVEILKELTLNPDTPIGILNIWQLKKWSNNGLN